MREKISIQFIGFPTVETLEEALQNVAHQTIAAELELNICDPEKKLDRLPGNHMVNLCTDQKDPFGILSATGNYIAIYMYGFPWRNPGKLEKQLTWMQKNAGCTMTIHDVEFVKANGYPVDQDVRYKFMKALGYEDYRYGVNQLQKFVYCGFFGTWMMRNLFLNDKEHSLFQSSTLEPSLRLLTLLVANGECLNLYDDRFVSCRPDEARLKRASYPQYNTQAVQQQLAELKEMQSMLKQYGISTDSSYRLLHIANGAFNVFEKDPASAEAAAAFKHVFDMCFRPEYTDPAVSSEERSFFVYLQDKIRMYLTEKGTEQTLALLDCLTGTSDAKWAYSIRCCKNSAVRAAMKEVFSAANANASQILSADRKAKHPVTVFFGKVKRKLKKIFNRVKDIGRKLIVRHLRKKGFSGYMAQEWYNTVKDNLLNDKETPLKTKLWSYRRGFMPWRIPQYGISEENFRLYPSDRDYMYLHQINNSYKKWIEDKMTFRLVLDPFKQHLPKYYFQIIQRDNRQLILKLNDCPEGYEATFDELFRLLREQRRLALKAASGTHGVGFYKMHYENGQYYLNNKPCSEYHIRKTIDSFQSYYIVTEYIEMHPAIKNIYAGSVNTIRVMMINRDGHHPQLMDAYMRIGTEKSGVTDNVAYGGVVCTVNMETGEYGNGMKLANHVYVPIDRHPDTGTPLNGVVPNWELIKTGLTNISQYMGQLEYLGFDVVCTREGFVLLEANSHQDLHRLPTYDQRVRDFFFYKLFRKERNYKIKRSFR